MRYRFSLHARRQIAERGIPLRVVCDALEAPQQVVPQHGGRMAHQSRVEFSGRSLLVRVIVDGSVDPALVVTVYWTTRIGKYWRET